MGNELITRDQLQSDLETLYNNKISPYLNGATHTGFTPVGTIISYFGETAPVHYLICDGATYNKSDYPELWTHLSSLTDTTPYVVDGDNTKFKVPDLRGEFLRGTGTNGHTDQGSGANVGTHQDATEIPNISTYNDQMYMRYGGKGQGILNFDSGKFDSHGYRYYDASSKVIESGGKLQLTARPTNTSVLFCIAYKDIYIDYALDGFPVAVTNPQDKQGLTFDATTQKWVNSAGGMHEYSTIEKVVGTWLDGRPVYESWLTGTTTSSSTNVEVGTTILSNVSTVVSVQGSVKFNISLNQRIIMPMGRGNDEWVRAIQEDTVLKIYIKGTVFHGKPYTVLVRYTKTTDTPTVQS